MCWLVNRPDWLLLVLIGLLLFSSPSVSSQGQWSKYENAHFKAYSDAEKQHANELVLELERFRAATLQIANIEVPDSAPKISVLILGSLQQFEELSLGKNTAAFFIQVSETGSLIVLPATGDMDWNKSAIRHEYAHALLRFNVFEYPAWYEEGFAEMASVMEISDSGKHFIIGKVPKRVTFSDGLIFPWDQLIADEFDPHKIRDARRGSSAYAQAWILAHYTTLGGNLQNAHQLQRYFNLVKAGETSATAFEQAFEITPDRIWKERLKDYAKHIPTYTAEFKPEFMDTDFRQTPVDEATVEPTIRFLRSNALARWRGKAPRDPLSRLDGAWDVNSMENLCDDPFHFTLSMGGDRLTLDRWPGAPEEAQPITLDLVEPVSGDFVLFPSDAYVVEDDGDPFYINLYLRGEDVACWSPSIWNTTGCGIVLVRCLDL